MPHQIAVQLGVELHKALLLISVLSDKHISNAHLLIYHKCDNSKFVDAIPFGTGFPALPWTCPDCEEEVNSYSELSFDVMSKIIED